MRSSQIISLFSFSMACLIPMTGFSLPTQPALPIARPIPVPMRPAPPARPIFQPLPIETRSHLNPIQVDQRVVEIQRRGAPIGFQAFEVKDPSTGNGNAANAKPISRDTILTLPDGKQVKAGAYFDQLNQFEQNVNQYGYTLRTPGAERIEYSRTRLNIADQQTQQLRTVRSHTPRSIRARPGLDQAKNDHISQINNIAGIRDAVNRALANATIRQPSSFHAEKNWSDTWGWTDTFGAFAEASVVVDGAADTTRSNAHGSAGGYMFGQQLKILRGESNNNTPKDGSLQGDTSFYFLGIKLFDKTYNAANPLFYNDAWSQGLDENTTLYFTIGPIPMSAKLGAAGSAGLDFRMDLLPLHANSDLKPSVNSKIYIQVGVDIVVGGAGGGSDLILINDDLIVVGRMQVLTDSKGPYFIGDLESDDALTALQGRVYAYAWVYVPRWGLPPWEKKEYDWTIFQLPGIAANGSLFSYQNKSYL